MCRPAARLRRQDSEIIGQAEPATFEVDPSERIGNWRPLVQWLLASRPAPGGSRQKPLRCPAIKGIASSAALNCTIDG
jgi:hypothetical protein